MFSVHFFEALFLPPPARTLDPSVRPSVHSVKLPQVTNVTLRAERPSVQVRKEGESAIGAAQNELSKLISRFRGKGE